jgi:hypothetical protein
MERNISSDDRKVSWYSKSDLLWVIGKYIEENLDDDTDILVTVEYEDNGTKPQRVILETRPRTLWEKQTIYFSSKFLEESWTELEWENNDIVGDSVNSATEKTNVSKGSKSVQRNTSNKLTQKDQNEAEEIFSILF